MAGGNLRATLVGFAGAIAVFALLFYLVGVDALVAELVAADGRIVLGVVVVVLAWLAAWSLALGTVLDVLDVEASFPTTFAIFSAAMFSNNITPFGQAGGEPVTALIISRVTDAEYEKGLAAIASVDTLNFVPSITLALIGVGYYATEVTLGRNLEIATAAVVVLAFGVPTLVYAGWSRRYELESRVVDTVIPLVQRVGEALPRVTPPSSAAIERRINGFFRAIERIADSPADLARALAFSALGWLFQMVGLWLAFHAVGTGVSFSIILFVVPIAAMAGITPLPGGAGGIESTLVFLLVVATGPLVGPQLATAAVVIYRGAVYWIPIVIGGAVMGVLSLR